MNKINLCTQNRYFANQTKKTLVPQLLLSFREVDDVSLTMFFYSNISLNWCNDFIILQKLFTVDCESEQCVQWKKVFFLFFTFQLPFISCKQELLVENSMEGNKFKRKIKKRKTERLVKEEIICQNIRFTQMS